MTANGLSKTVHSVFSQWKPKCKNIRLVSKCSCPACVRFYKSSLFDRSYIVQFYLHILLQEACIYYMYVEKLPSVAHRCKATVKYQHSYDRRSSVSLATLPARTHSILTGTIYYSEKIYYTVQCLCTPYT